MTVCMYRDIHTLQPYIVDFTQRGCHTLRFIHICFCVFAWEKEAKNNIEFLLNAANFCILLCIKDRAMKNL